MHANLDRHRRDDIGAWKPFLSPPPLPFGLVTKVIIDSRCVQTTAPVLVSTYVDELQGIVNELENVVHPPLARSFSVPSFPDVKG